MHAHMCELTSHGARGQTLDVAMSYRETFELDERIPCSDGSCTGVLDPLGICGTCGRVHEVPESPGVAQDDEDAQLVVESSDAQDEVVSRTMEEKSGEEHEVLERVPCPDDTCVGIIGADGRCGTCGRAS